MKTIFHRLLATVATRGRYNLLHAAVLALVATAIFMMATSGDMGPMAPLIIACSFYLIFGAVAVEIALGLFALFRFAARRALPIEHRSDGPLY